ncbi:MAG: hypothetical protein IPG04_10525 [Polyangiaceae bacterium]|nr:hypothetical protein [Polyangiaceae bacterium]
MKSTASAYAASRRPELRLLGATEGRRAFHDRVLDGIRKFLEDHAMAGKTGAREFYEFEKALHERLREAEREIVGDVMAASDVDADAIEVEGRVCRRVLRSRQTYMTASGEVAVERWLYKDRADPTAHALAALDLRLGIVEGFWTQRAAEQASWVVTQMTPQRAEELFERVGNMEPSKSSLDRLPRELGERWEAEREKYEHVLREAVVVPEGTASIAVSVDGVLAPIDGGTSPTAVRGAAAREGRLSKGPAGYREVGCATLAFCDAAGDLISAIRFGRGPEAKKLTLKETLRRDLAHVLEMRPDLRLAKITDAGGDNWEYLATLPEGPEILDFFHATEHLAAAIAAVHGDGTFATRHKFELLRERLLTEDDGAQAVIRALDYLRRKHPRIQRVGQVVRYFRKNKARMRYAEWKRAGLMIGSGVVEAACKTLVAQRLKLSGMRWSGRGAQAILTMRGWDQSDRFDEAWALLAATYQREVHVLANVVDITPKPPKTRRVRASR